MVVGERGCVWLREKEEHFLGTFLLYMHIIRLTHKNKSSKGENVKQSQIGPVRVTNASNGTNVTRRN